MVKSAIVIGGGVGGLCSAILMASEGLEVTLFEKNEHLGGKLNQRILNGSTFDLGPTVLTMPFVLERVFERCDRSFHDYVTLTRVEPTCRYHWSDGTVIDAWSKLETEHSLIDSLASISPGDRKALVQYFKDIEDVYETTKDIFLFQPFGKLGQLINPKNALLLPSLKKFGLFSTVHQDLRRRFTSEKLIQLFSRFATYTGSSPYNAPATLNVIPHVEFHYGSWYPKGGMYAIIIALQRLAEELGVRVITRATVTGLTIDHGVVGRVKVEHDGDLVEYSTDVVVCNSDILWAYRNLLEPAGVTTPTSLDRGERSSSGYLLLANVQSNGFPLKHHNIFFGEDYQREFIDLFREQSLPEDCTIYLSNSSITESTLCADGQQNWYILINGPANSAIPEEELLKYQDKVMARLAEFGLECEMMNSSLIAPRDFQLLYNAIDGAIYGTSSNSMKAAFFRPSHRSANLANFFFAGGTVHPGGGVPLAAISGIIAADSVLSMHR